MSLAVLLAQHNDVTVLDIDPDRVDQVKRRESTVADPDVEAFLKEREMSLSATMDDDEAPIEALTLWWWLHLQTMTLTQIGSIPAPWIRSK